MSRQIFSIGIFLVLIFSLSVTSAQELNIWHKSPNGLEFQKLSLGSGSRKQLHVVRMAMSRQGVKILRAQDFGKRRMNAREICLASGAILCINSSFFDEKNNPLGLLISSGITFQKIHLGGDTLTGIFAATRKAFHIVSRDNIESSLYLESIQAGPRLVINKQIAGEFKETEVSRRSGICIDNTGSVVFFVTDNEFWAITLKELAEAMLRPDIGCVDGMNLDGGGSAQLYMRTLNSKAVAVDEAVFEIKGQEEAPVFIGVMEGLKF